MTNNTLKVDQCTTDQQFIAQQIKANGQAVAQLTMRQSEHEASSISEGFMIADQDIMFENVFYQLQTQNQTRTIPSVPHHLQRKNPYLTTPYPKCISQLLMVLNPKSGWTSATTTYPYIPFLTLCGWKQPLCS